MVNSIADIETVTVKGEAEDGDAVVPLGKATVVREGRDLTIVTAMRSVQDCIEAAERLAPRGIEAEVVDVRTLLPFDGEHRIAESVRKTGALLRALRRMYRLVGCCSLIVLLNL